MSLKAFTLEIEEQQAWALAQLVKPSQYRHKTSALPAQQERRTCA